MQRTVPNPPVPVAPVQGAPVRGDVAKLVWEPAEGATGYHVQVAADEAFTQRLVDTRLDDVTSLVVKRVLHGDEGTVFWRVAAIGPGGRGAFSDAAEFFSSAAPSDPASAGRTPEAGAETSREAVAHDPAPVARRVTGNREVNILIGVVVLLVLAVIVAYFAFSRLAGNDDAQIAQRDSVSAVLQSQQRQMNEQLGQYSADSAGYTIPIDSAMARMVEEAGTRATPPASRGEEQ